MAGACKTTKTWNNKKSDTGEYVIIWDQSSLKQLSVPASPETSASYSYPRMIEGRDGTMYCVFEHNGNIEMIKSSDKMNSWSSPVLLASSRNNINIANPEILELQNGGLIIAYNLRPQPIAQNIYDPEKKFSICVKRSNDNGASWQAEQLLYEAGADFKNGCWEPSMVQLPNGEIQLFFANEGPFINSDEQNISMLTSTDNGQTWSQQPQIVSFSKGYRDGMPVPVYNSESKEVLVAIEDNSEGGEFNPSVISLSLPFDGNYIEISSSRRTHLLQDEISTSVYAGAPYLRMGKNGMFVLSFQSTLNRKKDWRLSTMEVAVGSQPGKLKIAERPFQIPVNRSALWNSLCILNDGTIIALTSTNAFNNYGAIWMIKGSLKKN